MYLNLSLILEECFAFIIIRITRFYDSNFKNSDPSEIGF